jgi:hypothetical protein
MAVNTPTIDSLRISVIRTAVLPELLTEPSPSGTNALNGRDVYVKTFSGLGPASSPISYPWPPEAASNTNQRPQRFWSFYLKGRDLRSVPAVLAWERLVPVRAKVVSLERTPNKAQSTASTRARIENFWYPHGVGAIATVSIEGSRPLEEAIERVVQAVTASTYRRCSANQEVSGTLESILSSSLDEARKEIRQGRDLAAQLPGLFTIATVIHGQGVDPEAAIVSGSLLHKAINACCTFRRSWQKDTTPDLEAARVPTAQRAAGSVLFARQYARTLWFPEVFTLPRDRRNHQLACFHRNLTLAAMQTQSLLGLARWGADQIDEGKRLRFDVDELIRNSVIVLGLLYGKVDDIYQSLSVQREIKDSGAISTINGLRGYYGDNWVALS